MSRKNTFDTVAFTWNDPRSENIRELNTALRQGVIVIEDIKQIDDWTISRNWMSDPRTARQEPISHMWEKIVFEIVGVVVDDTKLTDRILRAWAKTAELVHMRVSGFEDLDRDFYIAAFSHERYGAARRFSLSCVDANGHITSTRVKTYHMAETKASFKFPFKNQVGRMFTFGTTEFSFEIEVHSESFIGNEPFEFHGVLADDSDGFELSNDAGQKFRINFPFRAQDELTINLIDSVFRLTRMNKPVSILPYIDYGGSTIFGIKQGAQIIRINEAALSLANITFVEHMA